MPIDQSISPYDEVDEIKINSRLILANGAVIEDYTGKQIIDTAGAIKSVGGNGTANTSVSVTEYGNDRQHITRLSFTDITVISPAGAANLGGGYKIYTLPAGVQMINSATMAVALTGSTAGLKTDTPDIGIGTVIGSGAVATLDGTATFENILTGQTAGDCNGTVINKTLVPTANVSLGVEAADAKTIHLNIADGWAGAGTVKATGVITISWTSLA